MYTGVIRKYVEPFIGGGALFFYVAQTFPSIQYFYISDVNEELMLVYKTIREDVDSLIALLQKIEKIYHDLGSLEQKEYYYKMRTTFNKKRQEIDFRNLGQDWVERTASIIFFNRTCFNGLFRVNSKGEFNVPFGDYKNPIICDDDNLRSVSQLLQITTIECADFTGYQQYVDNNTFVYFDPPYRPISKTASFTSYSKYNFNDDEQKRLADYYRSLHRKGAKLMLSNSDPKNENPDDHFFEDLYHGFYIERVDAARMINCNGAKRGKIKELVIANY